MDSRERTFLALDHQEPDRVPIDLWMSSGFRRKLETSLGLTAEEFLDRHDVDLRFIEGPRYVGPPLERTADGCERDIWGVVRETVTVATAGGEEAYREVRRFPLASATSVEEVNDYDGWPSPDWFDYSPVEAQCDAVHEKGRVAVFMGDRLNRIAQLKPAMYLRGVEQILVDLAMNPEIAMAVFVNIREFYRAYAERIIEAAGGKLDIVLTGDDFGSQNGPLVSPQMWDDFLGDGFAEYCRLAKAGGARVMHHTCGAVAPIIPGMIERGLDVLQSLQPEAAGMHPKSLKEKFGDRLTFHGGISIQKTMPFGSVEDVRKEVAEKIEALAPGGGYILATSHNVQADTPVQNVLALLEAHGEFGRYR